MKAKIALSILALAILPLSAQAGIVDGRIAKYATEPMVPATSPCSNHRSTHCGEAAQQASHQAGVDQKTAQSADKDADSAR